MRGNCSQVLAWIVGVESWELETESPMRRIGRLR